MCNTLMGTNDIIFFICIVQTKWDMIEYRSMFLPLIRGSRKWVKN